MKNKTILQEIGVSNSIVQNWLKEGLTITYPININKRYFKSEDGEAFVENADKYVPLLSKKEKILYTKYPEIFRNDFLKNARFYVHFINWLSNIQPKTKYLSKDDKLASLLSLLYLFQRAMDYHYFHFDRYLAYQNYPNTPVGYWWKKLKDASDNVSRKSYPIIGSDTILLKLLNFNKDTLNQYKEILNKKEYDVLKKILKNIKVFEGAQEQEIKTITDFKTKENTFFRTVTPIWENIKKILMKHPELIKDRKRETMRKVLREHPIIAVRHILIPNGLQGFNDNIRLSFELEIKRWTSTSKIDLRSRFPS